MTSSLSDDKPHINEEFSSEEVEAETSIDASVPIDGDPEEPGKAETLSQAPDNAEIDKLIGRGLKLPPVQDDGQW